MSERPLVIVNPSRMTTHVAYGMDENGGTIDGVGLTVGSPHSPLDIGFFITTDAETPSDVILKISSHLEAVRVLLTPTGGENNE